MPSIELCTSMINEIARILNLHFNILKTIAVVRNADDRARRLHWYIYRNKKDSWLTYILKIFRKIIKSTIMVSRKKFHFARRQKVLLKKKFTFYYNDTPFHCFVSLRSFQSLYDSKLYDERVQQENIVRLQ